MVRAVLDAKIDLVNCLLHQVDRAARCPPLSGSACCRSSLALNMCFWNAYAVPAPGVPQTDRHQQSGNDQPEFQNVHQSQSLTESDS
jgi:hypothetical protein